VSRQCFFESDSEHPGAQQPSQDVIMRALIKDIERRIQEDPAFREYLEQMQERGNPFEHVPPPPGEVRE
jgi:hypothetical protein